MSESKTAEDEWKENTQGFRWEPPEKPPDAWTQEEYTEMHDRVIGRRVEWVCEKCSKPFNRLDKARRHVERKHSQQMLEKYVEE